MATEYSPAPKDVISIAERLIVNHQYLEELNLGFLMRDEAAVTKGVTVLAKVYKPPAWAAAFGVDFDLIVELPFDIWEDLVSKQREAMVDYALCMIKGAFDEKKEQAVFKLQSPDVQAFRRNLTKYGLWWPGAEAASSAFKEAEQIALPGITKKGSVKAVAGQFVEKMGKAGYDVGSNSEGLVLTKKESEE